MNYRAAVYPWRVPLTARYFHDRDGFGPWPASEALYALRDSGDVVELSRGFFRRADAPWPVNRTARSHIPIRSGDRVLSVCRGGSRTERRTPARGADRRTHGHRPPRITYPQTEVLRFAADTFEVGLSRLEAAPGEWVRIYTPARTVIDLMRLRHGFGDSLALAALQRYLRRRDTAPAELLRLASMFDVAGPVRRALDVATAE